jgi:transcriptional regulator with XRE-family HTH domain
MSQTMGAAIREARLAQGWSQEGLAERARYQAPLVRGITRAAVAFWERDERAPSVDQLGALGRALGWAPEEIGRLVGGGA